MKNFRSIAAAIVIATFTLPGCASVMPVLKSVDQIARSLCAAFYGEKNGISADEAARLYCATREAWEPWIGPALDAQRAGGAASGAAGSHGFGDGSCDGGSCPLPDSGK
jgi:hypothetical protein